MTVLSSPRPRVLNGPRLRPLNAARVRRLDARGAHSIRAPRPKRIRSDYVRGGFMPGLSEDLSSTEVQVGYESPDELAGNGFFPGMGAFDVQSLMAPKNLAMMAGAAALGYFLFKRK